MTSTVVDACASSEKSVTPGHPKRIDGLDISPAEDGYIVYQPEQDRVHFLNATAVLILELCNGTYSLDEIIDLIKEAYNLPKPPVEVREALEQLKAEGLVL